MRKTQAEKMPTEREAAWKYFDENSSQLFGPVVDNEHLGRKIDAMDKIETIKRFLDNQRMEDFLRAKRIIIDQLKKANQVTVVYPNKGGANCRITYSVVNNRIAREFT